MHLNKDELAKQCKAMVAIRQADAEALIVAGEADKKNGGMARALLEHKIRIRQAGEKGQQSIRMQMHSDHFKAILADGIDIKEAPDGRKIVTLYDLPKPKTKMVEVEIVE